ncbi:MAG: hypothetical protein HYT15_00670 [Candidatus Magasanikbacteria bacterium]|nr:hypothetical protein [Candidatus Magasanikbacteria bacterium]
MDNKKSLPPSTERIISEEEAREWDEKIAEAKAKIDLQEISNEDVDNAIDRVATEDENENTDN